VFHQGQLMQNTHISHEWIGNNKIFPLHLLWCFLQLIYIMGI